MSMVMVRILSSFKPPQGPLSHMIKQSPRRYAIVFLKYISEIRKGIGFS